MTSRRCHFVGGLSNKKAESYYSVIAMPSQPWLPTATHNHAITMKRAGHFCVYAMVHSHGCQRPYQRPKTISINFCLDLYFIIYRYWTSESERQTPWIKYIKNLKSLCRLNFFEWQPCYSSVLRFYIIFFLEWQPCLSSVMVFNDTQFTIYLYLPIRTSGFE